MASLKQNSIYQKALRLLVRREYSRRELQEKLLAVCPEIGIVLPVIDQLEKNDLISDARFVDSYIRYRGFRGFGPQRLRLELRQKGLLESDIQAGLDKAEIDWIDVANRVVQKRLRSWKSSVGAPSDDHAFDVADTLDWMSEDTWDEDSQRSSEKSRFDKLTPPKADQSAPQDAFVLKRKCIDFLRYRGFTSDQIRQAVPETLEAG